MPKRLPVAPHLAVADLATRYRNAKDPVARTHFQMIWMLASGKLTREVVEATGYSPGWIREIARRYNTCGPAGLDDGRPHHPASVAMLHAAHGPCPAPGGWRGGEHSHGGGVDRGTDRQAGAAAAQLGVLAAARLHPAAASAKAEGAQQAASEKLPERVWELQQAHLAASVELWTTDEQRLGRTPIVSRGWAKRGQRPPVSVHHRYKWLYLSAFVRPYSGETHWLILPPVHAEVFFLARTHVAREVGAGPEQRILLMLDQAGYHTRREVRVPAGIA